MGKSARSSTPKQDTLTIILRWVQQFCGSPRCWRFMRACWCMTAWVGALRLTGSRGPYLVAMGLATALYGFLALFIAFRLARKYVGEQWAFLATLGIWLASSLPVYMYLNPSWAHALSAFSVALFLWYWDRTREARLAGQSPGRSPGPWMILGLLGGLMMDVYYLNVALLVFPRWIW